MKSKTQEVMLTISVVCLLIVLAVGAVAVTGKLMTKQSFVLNPGKEYAYAQVVVEPGDTLWSIARTQVPDEDPRDVVGAMRVLNQLESADIFPGQVLTVLVKQNIQPLQLAERIVD